MIAAVGGSNDEPSYVNTYTSKLFISVCVVVSFVVAGVRLVPMVVEMSSLSQQCHPQPFNGSSTQLHLQATDTGLRYFVCFSRESGSIILPHDQYSSVRIPFGYRFFGFQP